MKKLSVILAALLIIAALAACKAQQKVQEKVAEKAIENALGDGAKVNIDGDKYTYEDKDGNKMEFGSTEWPTDEAAAFIPKFDKGTVAACTIIANTYLIDVENVEPSDYESYLQTVKNAGFTENAFTLEESGPDGYHQYQGGDVQGNSTMVCYEIATKKLQIMGTVAEEE